MCIRDSGINIQKITALIPKTESRIEKFDGWKEKDETLYETGGTWS